MVFWSSDFLNSRLKEVVPQGNLKHVHQGAYELALGPEAYISGADEKTQLQPGDLLRIEPGQIAVLITEERVEVPVGVLGFISLKSSVKLPGLINVSGFHVDPGFRGRLVFTVYNAGSQACCFMRGDPLFLIWFANMDAANDPYIGRNQDQVAIASSVITPLTHKNVSPAQLAARLDALENWRSVLVGLLISHVVGLIIFAVNAVSNSRTSTNTPVAESKVDGDHPAGSNAPPTSRTSP